MNQEMEFKNIVAQYSKVASEEMNNEMRFEILPNPGAVSLGMLQVMGEMDKLLEELQ